MGIASFRLNKKKSSACRKESVMDGEGLTMAKLKKEIIVIDCEDQQEENGDRIPNASLKVNRVIGIKRSRTTSSNQIREMRDCYDSGFHETSNFSMNKAKQILASLNPEFPSFIKLVRSSNVTTYMNVPLKFCKRHMPKHDKLMVLVDKNGEEYEVKFLKHLTCPIISAGWKGFARKHKLEKGDAVIFQLVNPCKFKVILQRRTHTDDTIFISSSVHKTPCHDVVQAQPRFVLSPYAQSAMCEDGLLATYLMKEGNDREVVIQYNRYFLDRNKLHKLLIPGSFVSSDVIDCYIEKLSNDERARDPLMPRWYFPTLFSMHVLSQSEGLDHFKRIYYGPRNFTGALEHCEQIYIPYNLKKNHWVLYIIDLTVQKIYVCNTIPPRNQGIYCSSLRPLRKMLDHVQDMFNKLAPESMVKIPKFQEFAFDFPKWVPRQGYNNDCAIYICGMMRHLGSVEGWSDDQSATMRMDLAKELFRDKLNSYRCNVEGP